jgi:hypothetical protein
MFEHNLPDLFKQFFKFKIRPDSYLLSWCITLFCLHFDLPTAARVWDGFLLDGEQFVFRVAVAVLRHCKKKLLEANSETCQKILRTPILSLTPEHLMKRVRSIEIPEEIVKYYEEKAKGKNLI